MTEFSTVTVTSTLCCISTARFYDLRMCCDVMDRCFSMKAKAITINALTFMCVTPFYAFLIIITEISP